MYKVIVPGSLMLFGEHAVLHDKTAVVAAIDKKITVSLMPRNDKVINIISSLGKMQIALDEIEITAPFSFVLAAISHQVKNLSMTKGFDLNIESDMAATIGFGSSAAVTVATLAVLEVFCKKAKPELMDLFFLARKVIREVQGSGSGADVAASIFGGVVAYKMSPAVIEKISDFIPLVSVYSGKKTPTPVVIAKVNKLFEKNPNILAVIFEAIERCSLDAVKWIKEKNWHHTGAVMNINQGLLDALGVNDETLSSLIFALRKQPDIYGAKISGSGLGDCVIGIGSVEEGFNANRIDIAVSSSGIEMIF